MGKDGHWDVSQERWISGNFYFSPQGTVLIFLLLFLVMNIFNFILSAGKYSRLFFTLGRKKLDALKAACLSRKTSFIIHKQVKTCRFLLQGSFDLRIEPPGLRFQADSLPSETTREATGLKQLTNEVFQKCIWGMSMKKHESPLSSAPQAGPACPLSLKNQGSSHTFLLPAAEFYLDFSRLGKQYSNFSVYTIVRFLWA